MGFDIVKVSETGELQINGEKFEDVPIAIEEAKFKEIVKRQELVQKSFETIEVVINIQEGILIEERKYEKPVECKDFVNSVSQFQENLDKIENDKTAIANVEKLAKSVLNTEAKGILKCDNAALTSIKVETSMKLIKKSVSKIQESYESKIGQKTKSEMI